MPRSRRRPPGPRPGECARAGATEDRCLSTAELSPGPEPKAQGQRGDAVSYIHGRTDEREVLRLEKQARFAAPFILSDFDAPPGARVLDLACGVGAMAEELARRYPGIRLTGVDLSATQLHAARTRHPVAGYVRGDGTRLPFRAGAFDRVHCSWMLEHVPDPLAILREVRRVLAPGGSCHFIEVDNASFATEPAFPDVIALFDALNRLQVEGGGDPYVGRRLGDLLREAGFARVETRPAALEGSARDPAFFRAFVEEFAEIFESIDEAAGPEVTSLIPRAAAQLRGLLDTPGASMRYRSFVGRGWV